MVVARSSNRLRLAAVTTLSAPLVGNRWIRAVRRGLVLRQHNYVPRRSPVAVGVLREVPAPLGHHRPRIVGLRDRGHLDPVRNARNAIQKSWTVGGMSHRSHRWLRLTVVALILVIAILGTLGIYAHYEAHRAMSLIAEAARVQVGDSEASILQLVKRYGGRIRFPLALPIPQQLTGVWRPRETMRWDAAGDERYPR